MAIKSRSYQNDGKPSRRFVLTECPACGRALRAGGVSDHIAGHSPEDFGLSATIEE